MGRIVGLGLLLALVACTQDVRITRDVTPQPVGVAAPDAPSADTNPYGAPYPTTDLGYLEHARIPNLKVLGYRAQDTLHEVDASGDRVPITMADYYDPFGWMGIRLLHISFSERWCPPSNQQVSDMSGWDYQNNKRTGPGLAIELESVGVRFLDILGDGFTPGTDATLDDLRGWIDQHQINFDVAHDSQVRGSFVSLFSGPYLPMNIVIDTRTMEIVKIYVGESQDLGRDLKQMLERMDALVPPAPK